MTSKQLGVEYMHFQDKKRI